MKHLVLVAGIWLGGSAALAQSPDEGRYVSARDLAESVAKVGPGGSVNAPVPTGPGATVLVVRREAMGEVEVHDKMNDEFVVQSGRAQVRVGGKVAGARQTAPGEWRGGAVTGGRTYDLGPGDVLWIPAGSPHQVLAPKGGPFIYLAVKFEAK